MVFLHTVSGRGLRVWKAYIVAVVEDALARSLSEYPHVVNGINELLAKKEALGSESTIACRAVHGKRGLLDAIVAKELGELLGKVRNLSREAGESYFGLRHGFTGTVERVQRGT
jgi:hypothetical protein